MKIKPTNYQIQAKIFEKADRENFGFTVLNF